MATLDTGDGSPLSILKGVTNYVSNGGNVANLIAGGVFGVFLSIFTGSIDVIQSIFNVGTTGLDVLAETTSRIVSAVILEPLGIVTVGADVTQASLGDFGILGFLVGLAILLGGFFLIIQFLEEEETPDILAAPGFPDIPAIGPFDVGVTEENEEEN